MRRQQHRAPLAPALLALGSAWACWNDAMNRVLHAYATFGSAEHNDRVVGACAKLRQTGRGFRCRLPNSEWTLLAQGLLSLGA